MERKCWDCGNVAEHEDNIVPHVLCKKCGSQDTRQTHAANSKLIHGTSLDSVRIDAPCGNLGDNNHCDSCCGTGKVDPIEKACEGLISQLLRAREDVGHWIAFAERQMRELPDWEHLPCGPTTNGVRESEALRAEIAGVVRHYRQVTSKAEQA